jgi:hypothetical protein
MALGLEAVLNFILSTTVVAVKLGAQTLGYFPAAF